MATAGDVAESALKRILVQAVDAPLEPDDYADFLEAMNRFMSGLEADGIRLGYTPVLNVTDEVTIPDGAIRGLIANMAIDVSPDYGGYISASLVKQASEGMNTMRRIARRTISTALPSTLPIGSGNDYYQDNQFYSSNSQGILTLSGNTRATTFASADTAVRVEGFWRLGRLQRLDADISGRLITLRTDDILVSARLTATGNGSYIFHLFKNGVTVSNVPATLSSTPTVTNLTERISVAPGDSIQVFVECVGGTDSCTVADAVLEAV